MGIGPDESVHTVGDGKNKIICHIRIGNNTVEIFFGGVVSGNYECMDEFSVTTKK